ncbi:uncharacterized protein [Argopecten irradians]|uniref:uncharacterized protein n=1 Tax=Argopecten irradians TaxID=31199 RepID=UPI00371CCDFF
MSTEEEQSQTESSQLGPRKTVHQSGRTETGGESRLTTPNGRRHDVLKEGGLTISYRKMKTSNIETFTDEELLPNPNPNLREEDLNLRLAELSRTDLSIRMERSRTEKRIRNFSSCPSEVGYGDLSTLESDSGRSASTKICLLVILACVCTLSVNARCRGWKCGCVFTDKSKIDEKDLIYEELRTLEKKYFDDQLERDIRKNWIAHVFRDSCITNSAPVDQEVGRPICPVETRRLLGFWKKNGEILCEIIAPGDIYIAQCCGEQCCGPNTRCEPSTYVRKKFLVYCNTYFKDDSGRRITFTGLEDPSIDGFDESTLDDISDFGSGDSGSGDTSKRDVRTRRRTGMFSFRNDAFPLTCSCRTCDW